MDKEKAKEKLKELIEKFRLNEKEYKSLSEPDVETKLIRELFVEVLGWTNDDFFQQTKVMRGEKRGRADYEFRIGDKKVFYIEVKRVGISLDKEADKQVISYALSKKNVPFAISTNFKQLKIFCVEEENAINQIFRVFSEPEEYLSRFEDFWLLSKESFRNNLLLKQAEKEQRLKKRVSIDKYLLEDLMYVRKLISDDIEKRYSSKYNINEKDEIVQRILDRLIFIRKCEDVGINPNELMLGELTNNSDERAYSKLKEIFKIYDDKYNSGLFSIGKDNDCDKITISGKIIKKLIGFLYESKNKQYIYNFDWIGADVLGQVYEQYLGKILHQTKSGKAKLKEGQVHRKEQGIYYTPTYIVDYIIKNTIGQLLKERRDIKKLKIIDPACGSGSFLIKAFDYLYDELKKGETSQKNLLMTDKYGFYSFKTEILKNNLYGVDLDYKAVEITKLNLLLKAAEKNRKLPEELDLHIQKGNSLIDDESVSPKDYFKWQGDFQEGTFDVVVGNPPYVDIKQLEPKMVKCFFEKYSSVKNRMNLYAVFVERALSLLKEGGYFGFIIPNSILYNESYKKIRELLLENVTLKKIVKLPDNVFQNVKVETIILIYQKIKETTEKLNCETIVYPRTANISSIEKEGVQINNFNQKIWETDNKVINISTNENLINLLSKIEKKTKPLLEVCDFSLGLTPYDKYKGHTKKQIESKVFHSTKKENNTFKPLLSGSNIIRYGVFWDGKKYISYGDWLGAPRQKRFFTEPRIIVRQILSGNPIRIYSGYTEEEFYNTQIGFNLISKNKEISLKYILGIFNSNLMSFYHREKFLDKEKNLFQKILIANAKNFPIQILSKSQQQKVISLVDRILEKNKQLQKFGDKQTSETGKLQLEVENIDKEINEEVYKLYKITEEEKKVIEESFG